MHFAGKHPIQHKRRPPLEHSEKPTVAQELVHPEHTGSEAAYLQSLVDSHAQVTVLLDSGERLRGRIRYYDQDCFSIGLSAKGPRIFLRKASVCYISED